MKIKIEGLTEAIQAMNDFGARRAQLAIATGLTRTVVMARNTVQERLPVVFDRPTPYTKRNIKYIAATAKSLTAYVGADIAAKTDVSGNVTGYIKGSDIPSAKYLQYQVDGGARRGKRFEVAMRRIGVLPAGWVAVPGERAKIDAYGNQSVGELRQIMSFFDAAEPYGGSTQNMGDKGRAKRLKGTRKKSGFEYVAVPPDGLRSFARSKDARGHWSDKGTHKMQPGIYRRTYMAMGTRVEPVVIFVRRAQYKQRFDFEGIVQDVTQRNLVHEIDRALSESVARLAGR